MMKTVEPDWRFAKPRQGIPLEVAVQGIRTICPCQTGTPEERGDD